ncbi:FAD binding domain protein [Cordyceps militaris CM01]|uniref:FAD binding domain protein n=1 Tax=Cordyceps militaris (strain CM01) TaxID=983644 RepID=G3JKR5_CORMM|nr:FAD binding domain protein [Cordyceps militaris CM01]EGX91504.1 FAD binding domain protein [Cordyceps militaris CM01]
MTVKVIHKGYTIEKQQTDVLIVGAGPAGCMSAVTLQRYGIDFRVIDKRPTRTQTGHASAFQPRTQEILQTINILSSLDTQGHRLTETSFWLREGTGSLRRTFTGAEVVHATPYQYLFNTDQGKTESIFEDELIARGQKVHRFLELLRYEYNPDSSAWPLTAYIKNHASGAIESWQTKYILGCDGARSATRREAGIQSSSQGGEHVWAVADVYAETDFLDYRRRCAIQTPDGGCMLIPRKDEGVRIFLQVDSADVDALTGNSSTDNDALTGDGNGNGSTGNGNGSHGSNGSDALTSDAAFQLARIVQTRINNVLTPYHMDITDIVWISQYRVSQRVVHAFHDADERVFLLGDACHTHSPKAGQGMNVGICDAYNLTWKLAAVLRGAAVPALLRTYEDERLWVAQRLIEFDAVFAKQFAQRGAAAARDIQATWEQGHGFTSGLHYQYPEGMLVDGRVTASISGKATEPLLAGKRILPIDLVRHIDGTRSPLLDVMPSNGRFHLFVFAGKKLRSPTLKDLAVALESAQSPLRLFNESPPPGQTDRFRHEDITSTSIPATNQQYLIDLFLVHSEDHLAVQLDELPAPFSTKWLMRIYADVDGAAHSQLGVMDDVGALVVVRPDGYVGMVAELTGLQSVTEYFSKFMIAIGG